MGVAAVMLAYGLLGATLGLVLRSLALAIGIGAAYVLPIDWILSGAWPDGAKWLLGSLTESGSEVSLAHALIVLAAYGLLLAAVAIEVFRRKDVLS